MPGENESFYAARHHGVAPGIAFLVKPITPNALLRRVREVLEGR